MLEKWWIIEGVGFTIIENQNDRLSTSSKFYFQAFLSAIALGVTVKYAWIKQHTDRGSQYASASHRVLLNEYGIIQSMSRKGNCWDNGVPRRRI